LRKRRERPCRGWMSTKRRSCNEGGRRSSSVNSHEIISFDPLLKHCDSTTAWSGHRAVRTEERHIGWNVDLSPFAIDRECDHERALVQGSISERLDCSMDVTRSNSLMVTSPAYTCRCRIAVR
jgi:hypothetical protein